MKNLFTLLFLFSAFISHAQRTLFGGNNNYVAPVVVAPPALVTAGLVLNLDAGNTASYCTSSNQMVFILVSIYTWREQFYNLSSSR